MGGHFYLGYLQKIL